MKKFFALLFSVSSLFFFCFVIAAAPRATSMTTEILSTTPHATLMRCIFDEAAIVSGDELNPGKVLLAVAPQGIPTALILRIQLGKPLAGIPNETMPESVDELVEFAADVTAATELLHRKARAV